MLKGKHTFLKAAEKGDAREIVFLIHNSEVSKYLITNSIHITENTVLANLYSSSYRCYSIPFAIYEIGTCDFVGFIVISDIHPINRSCEIKWFAIKPEFQKKGYGVDAGAVVMKFLFNTLNLNKVSARTFSANKDLEGIYKLGGFKKEGTLRSHSYIDGKWEDCNIYGVLKEEFNWEFYNGR